MEDFTEAVLAFVDRVPAGRVVTYGLIADHLGRGGARHVGRVMSLEGAAVAWWRVVRADGSLPPHLVVDAQREWAREKTPVKRGRVDVAGAGVDSVTEYVLRRVASDRAVAAPTLDESQQAVLDHFRRDSGGPGGPLQVLAGPGTGKTTTVVELVVDQVENGGLRPEEVLVLTFSRKAAQDIRTRIARRLARTTATTPAMTFHSFSYALLRAEQPADAFAQPLRLLSAPEFDAAIADILGGTDPTRWPASLRDALGTRGMASELRKFLSTARAQGMDSLDVERVAATADRDDWLAAGQFFDELTSVAALANTIDHTDLIFQAVRLLDDLAVRDRWRSKLKLVVVDEYQDTDPLQVALLKALAGDGRDLVVVGDPYQSIYGFRGADVRGIVDFPHAFATARGPAPRLTLSHTNRYGPAIAAAVRSIVENRGVLGATDGPAFEALRNPASRVEEPGSVEVRTFVSPSAEAEHIALLLREAHLHDGVPWGDMAVLVRSGQHLGRLQRALSASGVPVEVAGDELPVALEPSVRTLLAALHAADAMSRGERLSPRRRGRAAERTARQSRCRGVSPPRPRIASRTMPQTGPVPRPSRVLIAEALADPVYLATLGGGRSDGMGDRCRRQAGYAARTGEPPDCCRRVGRAGAVDAVGRHELAEAAPSRRRSERRERPARQPRSRRRLRPLRRSRARRGAGCASFGRRGGPGAGGAADPGGLVGADRRRGGVGSADDRASLEGAGVALGGGRGRAGRRMAGRPGARQPAAR